MTTPPPEDLLCAADWIEAFQGEDRERLARVADWIRQQAERKKRFLDRRAKGAVR